MSRPLKRIRPAVGSHNLRITFPMVDFPLPLSPTNPRTDDLWNLEADVIDCLVVAYDALEDPFLDGKYFLRP